MKKLIFPIIILALLSYIAYDLINYNGNSQEAESLRIEYDTKVSQLNALNVYYFKQNKDLISEVKDLKIVNEIHRNKRAEIKTEWRDRYLEAKSSPCDTNIIADLGRIHEESEAQCDSSIANLETQVNKLEKVISNDSIIIQTKDSVIDIYSTALIDQEELTKKEKRKKVFWKITTGVLAIVAVITILN